MILQQHTSRIVDIYPAMLYCVPVTQAGCSPSPTLASVVGPGALNMCSKYFIYQSSMKLYFKMFTYLEKQSFKEAVDVHIIHIGQLQLSQITKFTAKLLILALYLIIKQGIVEYMPCLLSGHELVTLLSSMCAILLYRLIS